MSKPDARHEAMRMISKMMQSDPRTPEFIRIDFAIVDKFDELRDKIANATEVVVKLDDDNMNTRKAWLEYLQLMEAGLQSFLDSNGIQIPCRQGGAHD